MTFLPLGAPPLLVIVLFYALYEGPFFGALLGCVAGFLMDLYGVGRLGSQIALYAGCGAFAGFSASKFFRDSFFSQVILPVLAVYFMTFSNLAIMHTSSGDPFDGLDLLRSAFVPQALIITAVTSPLLFALLKRISLVPSYRRR